MECLKCKELYRPRPGDYTYAAWCDKCEPGERRKDALWVLVLAPSGLVLAHLLAYLAR